MNHDAPEHGLRILCVSPLFVPTAHAEAFVAAKWALALVGAGADVTVLGESGAVPDGSALWDDLRRRTVVVDPPADSRPLASLRLGLKYRALRVFPRWIDLVVRTAAELHRDRRFNLVCSRSLPMRAHIAGCWCARALGVPWAANLDDPWDLHSFPGRRAGESRLRRWTSDRWLRETMRSARLVTGPCARLNDYNARLARSSRRIEVVPHIGWAMGTGTFSPPGEKVPVPIFEKAEGFRLVHAGALGREALSGDRSGAALLTALAGFLGKHPEARAATKLRLVGPSDPETDARAAELSLAGVVECAGRVSYEDSLREIAAADVCVLVEAGMTEGIYLPSKFADYIAAGKPVLALSPSAGTVADLLPDAGIVRCDPGATGTAGIERAIEGLYEEFRAGRLSARRPSEALARRFSASSVAAAFLSALQRAGGRDGSAS